MGILEQEVKNKDKRKNIQKIILNTIFAAGIIHLHCLTIFLHLRLVFIDFYCRCRFVINNPSDLIIIHKCSINN